MVDAGRAGSQKPPRRPRPSAASSPPGTGGKEPELQPTDIRDPDYFHKVVDCQWACPAHTPVPEYIRLIAAGRYADAFMINWHSNVFPGILGRTCDRPCEPACRRGRVEEEPVAICRLKRVAADYKGDISDRLPQPGRAHERQADRPGRRRPRLADRRARPGPARLPLRGLRHRPARRRHDPQPDPEIPPARAASSTRKSATSPTSAWRCGSASGVDSLKALLAEDYDAIFVGSGAPRGRDLPIPGRAGSRGQHPYRHRLAVLGLVRPHRQDRPARDRAGRRQHGDGLLPLRPPPRRRGREGHRPLRLRGDEGVALGKGGRHARGHPDPQLAGAEGIHARQRHV